MRIIIAQINCNIRRKDCVLWIQLCLNICIWNRDKTWLCIQRVGGSCKSRSTIASNYVPEDFYLQLYLYPYRYSGMYPYFHLYLQIQVRRARNSLLTFCLRTYRPVFSPMPCHATVFSPIPCSVQSPLLLITRCPKHRNWLTLSDTALKSVFTTQTKTQTKSYNDNNQTTATLFKHHKA